MSISTYAVEEAPGVVVWVVAQAGSWVPGTYESDEAARLAASMLDDETILRELQPIYNAVDGADRAVTLAEVQAVVAAVEGVG